MVRIQKVLKKLIKYVDKLNFKKADFCPNLAPERRYSASLDTLLRLQRAKGPGGKSAGKDIGQASEQEMARRFQRLCLLAVNIVVHRGR